MKTIRLQFFLFAAVALLAACSEDEPQPIKGTAEAIAQTVDESLNFTVESFDGFNNVLQDDIFFIPGENFSKYCNSSVQLINNSTKAATTLPALSISTVTSLIFKIPAGFPLGEYQLKLISGKKSKLLNETVNVVLLNK